MTTLTSIDLTCPNCRHDFTSSSMPNTEPRGRKRTDFQVKVDGVGPLQYGVHLCERCGYAAREELFQKADSVSYEVQRHVWDELAPRVFDKPLTASEKYEFAARVAEWDGAGPGDVADLWLRAAWCCVDELDIEAERYYRRFAVRKFEDALDAYDNVAREDRAVLTYLVGELWRRIGNVALANDWFGRVPGEIVDREQQAWLVRWARQQKDCPREWFI